MVPIVESALRDAQRYLREGDSALAERSCRAALATDRANPAALDLLAQALAMRACLEEAVACARQAVAVDSADARYQVTLGDLLVRVGHSAEAIAVLQQAVALDPGMAQAHLHLGHAYVSSRCPTPAQDAYRAAISLWPAYGEAHRALGRLLHLEGRAAEALAAFESAVAANSSDLAAYALLADTYLALGDPGSALRTRERATEASPQAAQAWYGLAQARRVRGDGEGAAAAWTRGLEIDPDHVGCLMGLAQCHAEAQRHSEVSALLRRALERSPDHPEVTQALARARLSVGDLDEAERLAKRACALTPRDPNAFYILGNVLLRTRRPEDALGCYRQAQSLGYDTPKLRFAFSAPLLMMGKLSEGWAAHEARIGMRGIPWKIRAPMDRLWRGEPIGHGTLLVHTEQGIGDTLQFARYLPLLRARLGVETRIHLLCEPSTERLMATVEGIDELLTPKTIGDVQYDMQVPLLSLPHLLGTTLKTIPAQVPYIQLPAGVHRPLPCGGDDTFKVALAWAGSPTHSDDRMRSCPVEQFKPLFDIKGARFYSIQVGPRAADIEPYLKRPNVFALGEQLKDMADTLSVMDQVDLVIAVDTSVIHLAGAYGKPVWILLAYGAEWRWLLEREDTPWYPSMRLFRQSAPGDWTTLLAQVRTELERRVAQTPTPP